MTQPTWALGITARLIACAAVTYAASYSALAQENLKIPSAIAHLLQQSEAQTDYFAAALAIDKLADPASDTAATEAMVVRLVDAARQMAGPNPTDAYKLAAIRKAIYAPGPWNHNRAFAYDLADPLGRNLNSRLLSTYVRTRKGNCVSMPILFLIVADRMGLNVRLATAPLHVLVRYTDPASTAVNLEATSGAPVARDAWHREQMKITDRAVASGAYLRTLSRRETVAEMAATLLDRAMADRRYDEAVAVADAILAVNPREPYVLAKKGTALGAAMQAEVVDRYPGPRLVPSALRPRYERLGAGSDAAFAAATALGWTAVD